MLLKTVPVYPTNGLHYDATGRKLVGDLSDLGPANGFRLGRIYDDAADVGLVLRNPKTGNSVTFALATERRDGEGDLQALEFVAIPECERKQPNLQGLTLVLFND